MKILILFFFFTLSCSYVSAASDPLDRYRLFLINNHDDNSCAITRSCTPDGYAKAKNRCQILLNHFKELSEPEKRLCGNPRDADCRVIELQRVCSFVCDPTDYLRQESLRLQTPFPHTTEKSLYQVVQYMFQLHRKRIQAEIVRRRKQNRTRQASVASSSTSTPPPRGPGGFFDPSIF